MNPTNEQELRELAHIIMNADTPYDAMQFVKAHTNAEIARTLDRLEAEFDRHAQSIGLWGMEGLVLDTLARTGDLSSEQKIERDAMVTERRALAVLHGAIQAERAKLKERDDEPIRS